MISRIQKFTLLMIFMSLMLPVAQSSTRDTMHLVYAALAQLLPLALDEDSFDNDESMAAMKTALSLMERSAATLKGHGGSRNLEFDGLARSFENNIVLLQQMLSAERRNEFNYLALDLTQNCVSCHARLPANHDFEIVDGFSNQVMQSLESKFDQVQLQIATRQFDAALLNLESMILDPEYLAIDLELDGVLFDYLSVGIQVTTEFDRIEKILLGFVDKPRVPYYLKRYAKIWIERLNSLVNNATGVASMNNARSVFKSATSLSPIPNAQARLVDDLVAASLIRRLLDGDTVLDSEERSELYWMLGVISIRSLNPRPGVPQTEVLLEATIRNAPGSYFAKHAYALLEEFNRVSFAGIPVAELPDTLLDLEELKIMAGAK
ncbi:MAG: hypothetical protein ACI8P9_001077 [Parasphingorhabdus sp.]|jgi:hypothetical protein